MGAELDVGEFPERTASEDEDPQALHKLTAHLIARVGDRFSFLRKWSRQMEGENKRAGLLSDAVAVLVTLYKRNPEIIEMLAVRARDDFAQRRAQRVATATANGASSTQPTTGGLAHHA